MLTSQRGFRFRGAYCSIFEGEALPEIFGDMDVVEATLPAMARSIVAQS
jgi:2-haloacid dehalogenase